MNIRTTASFARDYSRLPSHIQKRIDKQLVLLLENPRHPSLSIKKMQGHRPDIWELRVTGGYRITFQVAGDTFLLRRVGPHDILKTP